MKTADLIAVLAADSRAVKTAPVARRILIACSAGAVVTTLVLVFWLGLQPLGKAIITRTFWMKAGYTVSLALAGLLLVMRLARPGGRAGWIPLIALAAVALMCALSGMELSHTPAARMRSLWMGQSWSVCPIRILILAIPVYAGSIWALRRLAPTRLALTGAAAGLLAGGVGGAVYCLYCSETAATFVVTWYTLGIGACAAVGAIAGARLLRW